MEENMDCRIETQIDGVSDQKRKWHCSLTFIAQVHMWVLFFSLLVLNLESILFSRLALAVSLHMSVRKLSVKSWARFLSFSDPENERVPNFEIVEHGERRNLSDRKAPQLPYWRFSSVLHQRVTSKTKMFGSIGLLAEDLQSRSKIFLENLNPANIRSSSSKRRITAIYPPTCPAPDLKKSQ